MIEKNILPVDESKYAHLRKVRYPLWLKIENILLIIGIISGLTLFISIFISSHNLYKYSLLLTPFFCGITFISIGLRAILLKRSEVSSHIFSPPDLHWGKSAIIDGIVAILIGVASFGLFILILSRF